MRRLRVLIVLRFQLMGFDSFDRRPVVFYLGFVQLNRSGCRRLLRLLRFGIGLLVAPAPATTATRLLLFFDDRCGFYLLCPDGSRRLYLLLDDIESLIEMRCFFLYLNGDFCRSLRRR